MTNSPLQLPIFVIDDEQHLLDSLAMTLHAAGYEDVTGFADGRAVLKLMPDPGCSLVLLDLFMPGGVAGEEILDRFRSERPDIPVVVITGVDETHTAVRCMKAGAFDYLVKPVETDLLIATVGRALDYVVMQSQNQGLREKLLHGRVDHPEAFAGIITANRRMQSIFCYMEVIAPLTDPVLVTGETGTGKDLVARVVHRLSGRSGPFISVNVAGLDDNMFADTLFGHLDGAFTNAVSSRKGLVEQAAGGTLFLDEIGDLAMASQVKLLKLIQDREYYALGADKPFRSKVRIVAATNLDLESAQNQGRFRKDLFHRINAYHVHLPPLRERDEDILLLARHFLEEVCAELSVPCKQIGPRLAALLQRHDFAGNVRELRAMMLNAMAQGGLDALEGRLLGLVKHRLCPLPSLPRPDSIQYPETLPSLEHAIDDLIHEAIRRTNGNQAAAARMLGISRQAVHQRLKHRK